MKDSDLAVFSMRWLVENSPVLVVLLLALAPVLSVCVAGYAVHVIGKLQGNLRDVIEHVDELRFGAQAEKHELSHLYEAKIKNMGNAGRNGGEYYTPRPLIRAMIKVLKPKIGERIYDGACGSAGFLCEAFEYLSSQPGLTTADLKTLQTRTFYGKEKKSLAYVIAIMNIILHGIEAPNVIHANTLAENIADIQDKDRFDVILANPPFGGKERKEVQQNFPIKTGETAFLFLQHFIKTLKAGGRAAIVIKNTFLSNTDNASTSLRKLLLESCNLHTILDCPGGTFQGAGVKTVVLFFEKGTDKQQAFIDFVLAQYVKQGAEELDQEKLSPLLRLRYKALNDAFAGLGNPEQVRQMFVGFQRHLYEPGARDS